MNARIAAEQTETRADQAHARPKPELAALSAADLRPVNVDPAKTAQKVLRPPAQGRRRRRHPADREVLGWE